MHNTHLISFVALTAVTILLSNCAAPGPDPFLVYVQQRQAQIGQMPDGPQKAAALEKLIAEIG